MGIRSGLMEWDFLEWGGISLLFLLRGFVLQRIPGTSYPKLHMNE